jgi:hypothetical protein
MEKYLKAFNVLQKENDNGDIIEYPINEGSGFEKTISSLALRFIMTKISCLPKPNLVVLDEVLGKVSDQNLEYVSYLFDKAKSMFLLDISLNFNS